MQINDQLLHLKKTNKDFTPFFVSCEKGYIAGTYLHTENQICVSHTVCQNCFKDLILYLINKFKTNNILIHNVMRLSSWNKLRGFEKIKILDPYIREEVLCLKGKWQTNAIP